MLVILHLATVFFFPIPIKSHSTYLTLSKREEKENNNESLIKSNGLQEI
jgi:hypothetical protein